MGTKKWGRSYFLQATTIVKKREPSPFLNLEEKRSRYEKNVAVMSYFPVLAASASPAGPGHGLCKKTCHPI
jgi:hypothetical protein